MTRKPNRTRPLDRDGDGRDGGSLPGNQTAPMATADDLADARTTPGDSPEKLEAIEREVDEANAAARASTGNPALDAIAEAEPDLVAQALEDHGDDDDPHEACSRCQDEHPEAMLQDGLCATCVDEEADEEEALAVSVGDTFDAEQVAAGRGAKNSFELTGHWHPAGAATPVSSAVRIRELRELVQSRLLYRSAEGYSATYKAPFIAEETVKVWIEAGLAEAVPTAGTMGGIRATPAARREMVHIAGAYRDDAAA